MNHVHVYVACAEDGVVDLLDLETDFGRLTQHGRSGGLSDVKALAVDHDRGLLHAGRNTTPPQVTTRRISTDGSLEPVGSVPMEASTAYLSLDAAGEWLYSASYHDGMVLALPVAPDGTVVPAGGESRERRAKSHVPGPKAHSMVPSPDGRHVYAASLGADRIVWYETDTHDLEEAGSVATAPGSGPRHLRFAAGGEVLYALHEMAGTVTVYRRDPVRGTLTERQNISSIPDRLGLVPGRARGGGVPDPGPEAIWCSDLQLGADGRFLFTTERSTSTITTFAVDPLDGTLTYLRTTGTETQPRGAGVDPTGRYLLVCGELSGHLSAYGIDPEDGKLERTDRVATGRGPLWIETREA
ncbi:lactonase family protein [Arthrobacter halodurans]|uniref:Lactonase family protein n=1 Tax=Arthrobacter halodurans TaxID=516699 RepID=A0ABV4UQC7_9MICC